MFKGSYTALITPFRNGEVDEDAFRRLVEWQIAEGTHGLVPVGTTGESPTLDYDEHKRVIEITVEVARKRVPVIAGTGSNSTAEAIELSQHAEKAGADGLLVVTPYYNKPTQEGLYQHFKAINDAVGIPIIIYNIPGRSVVDMSVATMARCAELKNVVGVKDATANLARVSQQRARVRAGLLSAVGRGRDRARLHGAWRAWLHLGRLQHRAAAVRRIPERVPRGRLQDGAGPAGPPDAAARRAVHRDQSGSGEVCGLAARPVLGRDAPAAWCPSARRHAKPSTRRWRRSACCKAQAAE